jgi:alkanesulfonate monooxygenase SsuD/methylene tetrahydromethanopterin reductase-like flavin-dependent oxidoreductase (luciferase family)
MKIGISVTSAYRTDQVRDGAAQMVLRARAAAEAGLDSLFVGDHHVTPSPYYQNTPIMGRLLAEWDDRTAGALYLLPLWNPVLIAEQVATLACIAEGQFILQCGLGSGDSQFDAMGANIKHRPSSFEQSLATLRALWRGESVSLNGRWTFQDAKISPLPPEKIAVWIGASAPVAIERAARLGDAWLAEPAITPPQAELAFNLYQEALAKYGGENSQTVAIRRDIYIAKSDQQARALRSEVEQNGYRGFDPEALIIGDVASVAASFQAIADIGFTDIIVRNLHHNGDEAIASTERLSLVRETLDLSN